MKIHYHKMEGTRVSSIGNTIKNNSIAAAAMISVILILILRIPLTRMIGDAGVGLFAPAMELYLLFYVVISYSMEKSTASLIRYRVKREQFRSANKVFRMAILTGFLVSIVIATVIVLFSEGIAEWFFKDFHVKIILIFAAPVIVLTSCIGVVRGFFMGHGYGTLVAHSHYIEKIVMLIAILICGKMMGLYGSKVSNLLQERIYTYVYGAIGATLGLIIAQIITLVYLLLVLVIYAGSMKGRPGQDSGKRMDDTVSIQRILLTNSLPIALVAFFSRIYVLVDQRLFNICMSKKNMSNIQDTLWGCYYGKAWVLISMGAVLVCLVLYGFPRKIGNAYEREEYRVMRDRIAKSIRKLCLIGLPASVYLMVLSNAFSEILFEREVAYVTQLTQNGAILIFLISAAFLFSQILLRVGMSRELIFCSATAFLVHVFSTFIFVRQMLLGANGIILSVIIYFIIYISSCFLLMSRNLKYRQEWISSVAFVAGAACVSGVMVLVIDKLLLDIAGAFATIFIGLFLGIFFYILVLMLLKVLGEAELNKMPLGFLFIMIGRNIGILS